MATTHYANEVTGVDSVPMVKSSGGMQGGRVRVWRASFTLAAQADGDSIVLAKIPAGHSFLFGIINASATLGATATVAIGVSGSTGKYRAAATFTAAAPTLFGVAGASDDDPLGSTGETVLLTIAAAALPGAGTCVIDLFYNAP